MKNSETFNNLIDNAFDFLDKALEEFEEQPKYAVINFYTALELFLKARLLHEDWRLILSNQEAANRGKFDEGEFHSVNLKEAQKRLEVVVQQGLDKDAKDCFENLRKHRNRMVHFFHNSQFEKKEVENIVGEQCRAWYYLHPLLTEKWKDVFNKYKEKISKYNDKMHERRKYLYEKYVQLKPRILSDKNKRINFYECLACGYEALKENADKHPVLKLHCLVCNFDVLGVKVTCKHCNCQQALIGEPWHKCISSSCNNRFTAEDAKEILLAWHIVKPGDIDDGYEANCGECQDHLSVALLPDGKWMCSNCFTHFEEKDLKPCEFCGELTTEKLDENSFLVGCEHCDGEIGRRRDD